MSSLKHFDDYEYDDYKDKKKKKGKMKTLRNDDKYGSLFEQHNRLKNIDHTMFDNEDEDY